MPARTHYCAKCEHHFWAAVGQLEVRCKYCGAAKEEGESHA